VNAERKVEKIRLLLSNDGRGWDHSLEMLQEIESIVEPKIYTVTCSITEADMDRALNEVNGIASLREAIIRELNEKLERVINDVLRSAK
jgi:hypothetical protein